MADRQQKFIHWKFSVLFISLAYLGVTFFSGYWKSHENVICSDVVEYYSYLPAIFVMQDISMKFMDDDHEKFRNKIRGNRLANGNYVSKMSMGMSIMYSPFYMIGHVISKVTSYPTDGFSLPFSASLTFGSIFYYLISLLVLGHILSTYYCDSVVSIVLAIVSFGTNVTYYLLREPAMSHTYSFLLFSLFLYGTILWHKKPRIFWAIIVGLLIGLISLLRPTNALLALVFIFWNVRKIEDLKIKTKFFWYWRYHILCIAVSAICVWMPQMAYWYSLTGNILFYSYLDEGFFFTNPKIYDVLFGFRKGWFTYTPVMLISFCGFYALYKQYRELFIPIFIFMVVNIYVISSWWCWWYGGSYGHRAFIEAYVLMSFPLAAIIQSMFNRGGAGWTAVVMLAGIIVIHNGVQIIRLKNGALSFESMTKGAYFEVINKLHPTPRFYQLLREPDFERARAGLPERLNNY